MLGINLLVLKTGVQIRHDLSSEQEGWFQAYLLKTGFIVIPGVRERGDNCVLSTSCQLCHMILDESHDIKY
jgi:hypothetical protein